MARPTILLLGFTLCLLGAALSAGLAFNLVMHDGQRNWPNFIEAASFAVQTVTTVGYGNWENPALANLAQDDTYRQRVLTMRGWSVIFMFVGATFYALATGATVAILLPHRSD